MANPTSRPAMPWSALLLVLLLIGVTLTLCCPLGATGAVIGIDLGTDHIKVSTPAVIGDATAGSTDSSGASAFNTVDICLTEQSSRKSLNYVGFRNGERFFSDDAKNLAARFPDRMIPAAHRWVGVQEGPALRQDVLQRYLFQTEGLQPHSGGGGQGRDHVPGNVTPRGTVELALDQDDGATFSADELVAMLFSYLKRMAQDYSTEQREPVTEAVVTVPHFFTDRQRQALIDAAAVAGLRIISLIHPTTASALQYGIQNTGFAPGGQTVMILDVGSTSTHVGIYRYSGPVMAEKDPAGYRRAAAQGQGFGNVTTLALVSSATLGGRSIDVCVAKLIEDEAVEKLGMARVTSGKTLPQRKAINALMRAANKVKEMLSANILAPYTVEGLVLDADGAAPRDYSSKMTREFFAAQCVPSDAVIKLLDRALESAGIQAKQLHRVELIGGGGRIPQLLADIQAQVLGGESIGRTMNSDESAAIGAGYRAAFLTRSMARGQQGLRVQDPFALGHTVSLDVPSTTSKGPITVFSSNPGTAAAKHAPAHAVQTLPTVRTVRLQKTQDFTLNFRATVASSTSNGGPSRPDMDVRIGGVAEALDSVEYYSDLQQAMGNATHQISVQVVCSESGIVTVDKAVLSVTFNMNRSSVIRVPVPEERAADGQEVNGSELESNDSEATAVTGAENNTEGTDAAASTKTKKRYVNEVVSRIVPKTQRFPLTIRPSFTREPLPLGRTEATASHALLRTWQTADDEKLGIATAKNNLESYLVWLRVGDSMDPFREALGPDQRAKLLDLVESTSEWFDVEATDETARGEYLHRLRMLRQTLRDLAQTLDAAKGNERNTPGDPETPSPEASPDSPQEVQFRARLPDEPQSTDGQDL